MMNTLTSESCDCEAAVSIDRLLDHIHHKTFGRLHDLQVARATDGRLQISAVAKSRFVGQLAEWAVFDQLSPTDVYLTIQVQHASPYFTKGAQ